jgi:nitroreductase
MSVATKTAATAAPLHPLLADRWSPRAFDPSHRLTEEQLTALLEAARWAPSASNTQPWRFAVTLPGTPEHAAVLGALVGFNQDWAHAASALIVVAAQTTTPDGQSRPWAVYDTGQAVAHLSVQAEHEGLVVHQMGGFDRDRLAAVLGAPAVAPLVVVAVGQASDQESSATRDRLPIEELLLLIETGPSGNQIVGRHRAR